MVNKILVSWDSCVETVSVDADGTKNMVRRYKEKEYPGDVFSAMSWPDYIWDEEVIMEDRCGDLHFSVSEVLDVWNELLEDEGFSLDEEAEEEQAVIDFVKWCRTLPKGAWVEVTLPNG